MGELVALIEQMKADVPDIEMLAGVLAMAHVEGDGPTTPVSCWTGFASADFDLTLDQLWLPGMVYYAEAAIECEDPKYAAPLFDWLVPWADQLPCDGVAVGAPVSHHLGGLAAVLGRYDEADAYFARAAAMNDRMGAKYFTARTNLLWARMLTDRQAQGDSHKARELLTRAHTAAAANGYGVVERRAAAALERLS
jgi:tetratricopeptide (TPR) repeat protein